MLSNGSCSEAAWHIESSWPYHWGSGEGDGALRALTVNA